jgi:hypothetical protein
MRFQLSPTSSDPQSPGLPSGGAITAFLSLHH